MKTNRLHSIPYGPLTAELLENCYRSPDNRLFTKTERHHDKLVKEAGVEWFTRHDLRRSFATIHASIGTPQHVTERLLAHATPGGSAIHLVYNRFAFWDAQVEACERYEQFLSELVARG